MSRGILPDDLIGDENIANPCLRHDLRLAELGTGDADSTGPQLHPGDGGALVSLAVRPQRRRALLEERRHALDVVLQGVGIKAQRRCIDLQRGHSSPVAHDGLSW